jgi:hypothetical protein
MMSNCAPQPNSRTGFTVIEVLLYFSIASFLIVGLILGVQSSIARQRYNDSVNDLADFLKSQYFAVSNPELPQWSGTDLLDYNAAPTCGFAESIVGRNYDGTIAETARVRGQSRCQLYGRLITFGEDGDQTKVNVYLVTGMDGRGGDLLGEILSDLEISNIFIPALNLADSYNIPYNAEAQGTGKDQPLQAAILLVRPPRSGGARTLIANRDFNISETWRRIKGDDGDPTSIFPKNSFSDDSDAFKLTGKLDICVGSDDVFAIGGKRRAIRVKAGGGNASAIEILAADGEENPCEV